MLGESPDRLHYDSHTWTSSLEFPFPTGNGVRCGFLCDCLPHYICSPAWIANVCKLSRPLGLLLLWFVSFFFQLLESPWPFFLITLPPSAKHGRWQACATCLALVILQIQKQSLTFKWLCVDLRQIVLVIKRRLLQYRKILTDVPTG